MQNYNWHFSFAKHQPFLLFTNTQSTWVAVSWTSQRLLGRAEGKPPSPSVLRCVYSNLRCCQSAPGVTKSVISGCFLIILYICTTNISSVRVHAAYRLVYVHGVHISEAGSNLHPVFVDSQQIFFHKVHRKTSAQDAWKTWESPLRFIIWWFCFYFTIRIYRIYCMKHIRTLIYLYILQ